jgi:unsaturated rhamnogalacturonyl hydrolase
MNKFASLWLSLLAVSCQAQPSNPPAPASAARNGTSPQAILTVMKSVADWQLTHPSPSAERYKENMWTWGAFYAGVMALDDIADTRKYHDAMVAVGKKFEWQPAPRPYHADDQVVGQMYLELAMKDHNPAMYKPTQEKLDNILAHPSADELDFAKKGKADRWWWCDALFMGPPTWARMYKATGDKKYLEFIDKEWWATSDYLYDKDEHLYYRDSRYFTQKEANGKKIFWGRGNGWVMGGLARVLEMMPPSHPTRGKYEQQFKEMAAKVASLQQPDGLWRASLLDPDSYPLKETSGSGFYTYALAWGINHGLLDRAQYGPVVYKGWQALLDCVTPEGKLEHVQPVGADPKKFEPTDYEVYGAGAFLLAGKEMYFLANGKAPKK